MPRSVIEDPLKVYRYRIACDGMVRGGCSGVSGTAIEIDIVEYNEGGSETPQKSTGQKKFPNVTLRRGQIVGTPGEDDFYTWVSTVHSPDQAIGSPGEYRRDVELIQYNALGAEVRRWTYVNAIPAKYVPFSDQDASSSDNSFEEIEIAHEGIRRA
jgi:phage tail-like protein